MCVSVCVWCHKCVRACVCVCVCACLLPPHPPNIHLKDMLGSTRNIVDEVHKLIEVLKGTVTLAVRIHSSGHVAQDGHAEGRGGGHPGTVVCVSNKASGHVSTYTRRRVIRNLTHTSTC